MSSNEEWKRKMQPKAEPVTDEEKEQQKQTQKAAAEIYQRYAADPTSELSLRQLFVDMQGAAELPEDGDNQLAIVIMDFVKNSFAFVTIDNDVKDQMMNDALKLADYASKQGITKGSTLYTRIDEIFAASYP